MFETLSEKQREIVFDKSGKFVVRACPGSGKTYCASARLARLILDWGKKYEGIAAVSFTNVAWQEIEKKYSEVFQLGKRITFPHFLGTIDSFINKYLFLPYGHLVLKCRDRPVLVGEPHGIWTGKFFSDSLFDNISYKIDGSLYAINDRVMPPNWLNNATIIRSKKYINKGGYATQSDANYFAMKILERFPQIAKAVALRFPYLFVDEDFAKGKFLYDNGDFKGGFKAIERAILKHVNNLPFCSEDSIEKMINKIGFVSFKSQVFSFINLLPKTDMTLGDWVSATNKNLTENKIKLQLIITKAGKNFSFEQVFLKESEKTTNRNYRLGTVHSVKGETFDATLLVLKTKGIGKAYKTILNENVPISESEELRITYVGMTRPRKILVIAVPNNENKTVWESKLNKNN